MRNNIVQPEGNYYDKYGSGNPIVKKLMSGFFSAFDDMLEASQIANRGGCCLEAGCGEGHVTEHVSDWILSSEVNIRFSAFDISQKLIDDNQIRLPQVDFWSHDIYKPLESEHLPDERGFDLIICSEVLEHMERPKDALKNLMDYGNRFIISVPHEPIWRIMNMARGKYLKDLGNTPGHIQHFSAQTFCEMLRECGLEVVELEKPLPWLMAYCTIE